MQPAIETINLTKHFGSFSAVKGVSLSVGKGEIYGFLGLNGAGKTTTIRMLLGLIRPSNGQAYICGEPILPGGRGPWGRVGSLVEVPYSYPELTVRDNLEVVRRMRGIRDIQAVPRIAEKLGLTRYLGKKAGHLSLGNAQRLGIGKALLHDPEVLILDEPANGLDPAGIIETRELLRDLAGQNQVTIFVSSHILAEVARLATRIGIIHEGKLLREMDTPEIHTLRRRRLIVKTGDNDSARAILTKQGYRIEESGSGPIELFDKKALDQPELISGILVRAGYPPMALYEQEEDLESLFMHIIHQNTRQDG